MNAPLFLAVVAVLTLFATYAMFYDARQSARRAADAARVAEDAATSARAAGNIGARWY